MRHASAPTIALAAALLVLSPLARAQVSTASLAGWSVLGDAVARSGTITLTTAFLDGEATGDQPSNLSGRSAVDIGLVEAAAGVPALGLDLSPTQYGTEGSLVAQTFAGAVGRTLRFDWSFSSLDTAFLDRAFVSLDGVVTTLATTAAPGGGLQTFSARLAGTGPFSLAIGVIDTVDVLGVSSLTIGNLQTVAAVPEPANVALIAAGLAALLAGRRRMR